MTDREEFEGWENTVDGYNDDFSDLIRRGSSGDYENALVQRDWVTWQAARATAEQSEPVAIYQKPLDSNLGIWKDIPKKEYDARLNSKRIVYAEPTSAMTPEVRIHAIWSSGGCTGVNDYLMTDYSIRTLKASGLVKGQLFPPNDGSYETVPATNPYAASLTAKLEKDAIRALKPQQDAAIEAKQAESSMPEGWVLVPIEPTQEMMDAGLYQSSHDSTSADVHSIWKDMVAAAIESQRSGDGS